MTKSLFIKNYIFLYSLLYLASRHKLDTSVYSIASFTKSLPITNYIFIYSMLPPKQVVGWCDGNLPVPGRPTTLAVYEKGLLRLQ